MRRRSRKSKRGPQTNSKAKSNEYRRNVSPLSQGGAINLKQTWQLWAENGLRRDKDLPAESKFPEHLKENPRKSPRCGHKRPRSHEHA